MNRNRADSLINDMKNKNKHPKAQHLRGCIQKFPDWVDKEIKINNKHSLRSNTRGYGGKTHYTDSQNSDTNAFSGKELYHLHFSRQAANPETSGYTLVHNPSTMVFKCRVNSRYKIGRHRHKLPYFVFVLKSIQNWNRVNCFVLLIASLTTYEQLIKFW
jgi:hypothetical protein